MTDATLQINLNLAALWSKFFVKLQHLLDGVSLLEAGASVVTEEQVAENRGFMSFSPASNSHLAFPQATEFAQDWLLRAFLRDSIEITGLFLDECLSICALIQLAAKGKVHGSEVNHVMNVLPEKHHKLHFPEKLARLEREFGVRSLFTHQVSSLNRARTCVVHRLGIVSPLDVNEDNEMVVIWRTTQMVAREIETGKELVLDRPGLLVENESVLEMKFIDHQKRFALGEQVKLTPFEIYSCIVTFWAFGTSTAEAIENFSRSLGLGPDVPNPEV